MVVLWVVNMCIITYLVTYHWSDTSLVRHTIGPTHHWSDAPLVLQSMVGLYTWVESQENLSWVTRKLALRYKKLELSDKKIWFEWQKKIWVEIQEIWVELQENLSLVKRKYVLGYKKNWVELLGNLSWDTRKLIWVAEIWVEKQENLSWLATGLNGVEWPQWATIVLSSNKSTWFFSNTSNSCNGVGIFYEVSLLVRIPRKTEPNR